MAAEEWLSYVSIIVKDWLPEIVAIVVWTFLLWLMDFLPDKWKLHKRFLFMLKVKKTVCQIKVSVPLRSDIPFEKFERHFTKFWSTNTLNLRISEGVISFFSKKSSSNYEIQLSRDEEENKSFLIIDNTNGFGLGMFGGIKNLEETTDELQEITELFNAERDGAQVITSEFIITPRVDKLFKSKLKGEFMEHKYSCSFTAKNIAIKNSGFSEIKKNISKTIYDWMVHFI